jgi:hypothetical protein
MKIQLNPGRGTSKVGEFSDANGAHCRICDSSSADVVAIWLGEESAPMHLSQEHVAALLPHLQRFARTGAL